MPDPYKNPPNKPVRAPFTWVPNFPPTGGEVPGNAFYALTLERGTFRNDLPNVNGVAGSITTEATGTVMTDFGSNDWPILNAFRPLSVPDSPFGTAPGKPFTVKGQICFWKVNILQPVKRISAITLDYSVAVNLNDPNLTSFLSNDDAKAVNDYLASAGSTALNVDFSKYVFARVMVTDSQNNDFEFPALDAKGKHTELKSTDFYPTQNAAFQSRNITVQFGAGHIPENYKVLKSIRVENIYPDGGPEIQITINKCMIFNAERTNIRAEQLPCALLEYAFPVSFTFFPQQGSVYYPNNLFDPNFHVKFVHPDETTNAHGFAHSISLRFLIFATPIYGLNPIDYSSLLGLLTDIANPSAYMAVFIGPVAGKKTITFTVLPLPLIPAFGRVVRINDIVINDKTSSIDLQKAVGGEGDNTPGSGANWQSIASYNLSNPPAFDPSGPWVEPFLYLDVHGKPNAWYRIIEHLPSGGDLTSVAFNNQLYLERCVMPMINSAPGGSGSGSETIARNITLDTAVKPLDLMPIAIFEADDTTPFADQITIKRGPWKFNIQAGSLDPNQLATTHLFIRFWLRPSNELLDVSDPHKYRDTTEFYFNSTDTTTTLVRGTPTDLSQLMVSPPLPNEISNIELLRYMDKISTPTGQYYQIPFNDPSTPGSHTRANIVVGVYAISTPTEDGIKANLANTDRNIPAIKIVIDPTYTSFETSILQTLSHTIFPQRGFVFNSSSYFAPDTPLIANRFTVGGGKISGDVNAYINYNSTFTPVPDGSTSITSSLAGLMTLRSQTSTVPGKLCMPYTEIPTDQKQTVVVMADFATDGKTFSGGRVLGGNWNIKIIMDRDADTEVIGTDYRVEAMLVSRDGKVTERIFRTKLTPGLPINSALSLIEFNEAIKYPFLITGENTQLILRVLAYPYSRKGVNINIKTLGQQIGKPIGTRITDLRITTLTAERLHINQTDSLSGSPAFYEDLPLVPTQSLDSGEFWYVASDDNQKVVIIFPDIGWPISGCMYSPSWYVNLPSNMEVRLRAVSLNQSTTNTLWIRTVLGDEKSSGEEQRVSAVEEELTNTTHVAFNDTQDVSAQGFNALAAKPIMTHLVMNNPFQKPLTSVPIAGQNGDVPTTMEGRNPSLLMQNLNNTKAKPGVLSVVAQLDEPDLSSLVPSMNVNSGLENRWIAPNRDLGDNSFNTTPRRLSRGSTKHTAVPSPVDNNIFIASWIAPGAVVFKRVNPLDAGSNGTTAPGPIYVVDADTDVLTTLQADPNEQVKLPDNLNGKVVDTFPSIMVDQSGKVTVAYISEGRTNMVLARTIGGGGAGFGAAYAIADLRVQGSIGGSNMDIFAPVIAYHKPTRTSYLAFWVAGRVLVTKFDAQSVNGSGVILGPMYLACGSRDFTTNTNPSNPSFTALQNSGTLIVNQLGTPEEDLPQQSVGFYVSDKAPYKGDLFVVYKGIRNDVRVRHIFTGGGVDAPLILHA